jgi:hypothetical protein
MSERRQIGPTLFWFLQKPDIDYRFTTPSGRFEVVSCELLMEHGGGWLVLVREVEKRK